MVKLIKSSLYLPYKMVRLYSTEKETTMRRNRLSILKSAVELAILYFPLLFLSDLIEEVCPFANIYVQSTASALLCFCVLFSNSSKTALKKWSCSIPFTLIFYFVLAATNFDVRLINRLLPGYGHLSAGAGFAFIIEFGLFTIAQGIANLLAIACSNPLNAGGLQKMCSIIQIVILPIVCIIIVFAVLYLELTMPTWKEIYYSVYG